MTPSLGSLTILTATIATIANAHPFDLGDDYHRFAPRTEGFNWEPCEGGRECSRFEVPLDWHDPSVGKASLAVVRFPAVKSPKLGTLFINPGGPGGSGRDFIMSTRGEQIRNASGGYYDVLSWDPRGVGLTVPLARCAETTDELIEILSKANPTSIEARGNFTSKYDLDVLYAQVEDVDTGLKELGKRCVEFSPDTFPYMGTAAVVRDMVAMHDILEGKHKPIDYWGFSYGTIIGSYFVNMFPNRVGRVIIDGVSDPVYWANMLPHTGNSKALESADEAFAGFALACAAAGPAGCAVAYENSTADSIIEWTHKLLDDAYDYRKAVGPTAELNSAAIRRHIFNQMYGPQTWPTLAKTLKEWADALANVTYNNPKVAGQKRSVTTPVIDLERRQGNTTEADQKQISNLVNLGVRCSDAVDPGNVVTKDVFDFIVANSRDVSPMFGPMWADGGNYCHHWPVRAVERFTGPWNHKLSNPILVIGNEADPITPYISAKSVADALGDSAILIEQDDYGHVSLAMHSDCTLAAVQDYFVNNKLPSQDKFCGTNQELFPGPGITKKTLSQLSANGGTGNSNLEGDLKAAKDRGQKLFIAVIALAAASGLLLVSLVASCVRGHKKSAAHAYIPRAAFDKAEAGDEQGHIYADASNSAGGSKAGGYAPVQS